MSPAPKRILFVCTGNICRSAMAEHLLKAWSRERALGLEVRSCGVAAESHYRMPEGALKALARAGVRDVEHAARLATREPLRWADLVLVMTAAHRDHLLELYPEFTSKVALLRDAAGFGEQDVDDPMGLPDEEFERCLGVLRESLEALIRSGWA